MIKRLFTTVLSVMLYYLGFSGCTSNINVYFSNSYFEIYSSKDISHFTVYKDGSSYKKEDIETTHYLEYGNPDSIIVKSGCTRETFINNVTPIILTEYSIKDDSIFTFHITSHWDVDSLSLEYSIDGTYTNPVKNLTLAYNATYQINLSKSGFYRLKEVSINGEIIYYPWLKAILPENRSKNKRNILKEYDLIGRKL